MSDLLSQVHPVTRGIIWLTKGVPDPASAHYKEIDYLLNGLLTATLNAKEIRLGQVLVSENFGQPFFVMMTSQISPQDTSNFEDLISPHLAPESEVLVIDDSEQLNNLLSIAKDPLRPKIRSVE